MYEGGVDRQGVRGVGTKGPQVFISNRLLLNPFLSLLSLLVPLLADCDRHTNKHMKTHENKAHKTLTVVEWEKWKTVYENILLCIQIVDE